MASDAQRHEVRAEGRKNRTSEQKRNLRKRLRSKRRELSQLREEGHVAMAWERRKIRLDIYQLRNELRAAAGGGPQTGALPDFIVIGAAKSGTTYLYHLLTQHPLIAPAALKELRFFDFFFEQESVEWYRRCFPVPRIKDGRRTITGEATPYLFHPFAPERVARVVPQARLIALLRNPVDRAYSHYQMVVKNGNESLSFEEAIEAEEGRCSEMSATSLEYQRFSYMSTGIYVDHLLRWSTFFPREQMLVLKSEDFFERPQETLRTVFNFLDLPEWELDASEFGNKRNTGVYKQETDPATRHKLEKHFEPHNRRLYEYLGMDFGW
jgi:hypothetical protein